MVSGPVLIAGTTPDYIARIHNRSPESCIFLVDTCHQRSPLLEKVDPEVLICTPLGDVKGARDAVDTFLARHGHVPAGVACFDCESLQLAGRLASHLGLPFPSLSAIGRSRNKFESRSRWRKGGLPTPAAELVSSLRETLAFFRRAQENIVLKPVSGSGSELLFHCRTSPEVGDAVHTMERELPRRRGNPLFRSICTEEGRVLDPCRTWIAEEYVPGPEFSCDFVLQEGHVVILRTTGKVKQSHLPFGSVRAYRFPALFPVGFSLDTLSLQLERAAVALGFTWGHFMADFILRSNRAVILEMTPRPGGDSIPDLVETATGFDLLGLHLDFVSGKPVAGPFPLTPPPFASIHFYAHQAGVIDLLDPSGILTLPWVERLFFRKGVGDRVALPPEDYENRLLGYCIARVEPHSDIQAMCRSTEGLLRVSVIPDRRSTGQHNHALCLGRIIPSAKVGETA